MADVFLSYKRNNLVSVQRLVLALRATGLSVWWDHDLAPDAPWEAADLKARRSSGGAPPRRRRVRSPNASNARAARTNASATCSNRKRRVVAGFNSIERKSTARFGPLVTWSGCGDYWPEVAARMDRLLQSKNRSHPVTWCS
jgi:hypothetical protein